jgi:glycosyltransferase involved in cell wall biosynthesis
MENVFFSVIIPTLNEEDYLPKVLADLTKQRLKNFEVILVDGSSTDKTKEKALEFAKFFPLQFYTVKKGNVSYQRNFGAQKAKGEYLLFLDADARVEEVFTENIYKNILKKKDLLFLPTLTAEEKSSKNKLVFKIANSTIKLSQSLNKPLSAGGAIFITKKLFSTLNGFKEDLFICEDHNLIQRARKLGIKAKILKDVRVSFSLRRVKKEGQASVLYKYLLSSIHMLINGEITDKIYAYEMGGDKYKNSEKKPTRLRRFLKKLQNF